MLDYLTVITAYYEQPHMIGAWWNTLRGYDDEIRQGVHFVFVDDASPTNPLCVPSTVAMICSLDAYRIDQDIPWNQPGARNLAMSKARGWVLATDPDHVPSAFLLRKLLQADFERGCVYRLSRHRHSTGEAIDVPPTNVFVIHVEDFWKSGGYDEDFSGRKGFSDLMLLSALTEGCGFKQVQLGQEFSLDCYSEVIRLRKGGRGVFGEGQEWEGHIDLPDAAVLGLNRSMGLNKNLRNRKIERARSLGWETYIKEQRPLRFPWHQVEVF